MKLIRVVFSKQLLLIILNIGSQLIGFSTIQVVHYLYDEGKSSSNIRERFFAEDNRWPRSSSFCDDLAFHYLYGLEDGLFAESIIKEYPYVSDQFSFNGTFTDLKNKYNLDEDIIKRSEEH